MSYHYRYATPIFELPQQNAPECMPRVSPHRQRSEREASETYDYPSSQSKSRAHLRKSDQRRTHPGQSLHPKKAMEYQDHNQEVAEYVFRCPHCACCAVCACCSMCVCCWDDDCRSDHVCPPACGTAISTGPENPRNALDKNYKEMKKPARSQQVHTQGHSSKLRHAQDHIESQHDAADERTKRSSASPTEAERKHTTEKATNSQRARTKCGSSKPDHVETRISKS